jgi:hypothetical protein
MKTAVWVALHAAAQVLLLLLAVLLLLLLLAVLLLLLLLQLRGPLLVVWLVQRALHAGEALW